MSNQTAHAAILNEVNNNNEANITQSTSLRTDESRRMTNTKQQNQHLEGTIVEPKNVDQSMEGQKSEARSDTAGTNLAPSIIASPSGFVDGEVTPPLPNGQKRLHPLFDEDKIVSEAVARQEGIGGSTANGGQSNKKNTEKERPNALRLLDSLGNEAGYPSPSGGFVPPITDENWALQQPPVPRSADGINAKSLQADEARKSMPPASSSSSNHLNSLSGQETSSSMASALDQIEAESSNSPNKNEQSAKRSSSARHKLSSSQSSASGAAFESGMITTHSQAISARSSPSTLAPVRRRSSASADILSMSATTPQDEKPYLLPLKIRDFAYEEIDPRHVGARDVGLPSPERKRSSGFGMSAFGGQTLGSHEWGATEEEYDDDDDDDDDADDEEERMAYGDGSTGDMSTASSGLPPGLYHAAYDFSAESDHELNIKAGQRVRLIGHVDGGWAIVVRVQEGQEDVAADEEETEKGLVPEAYLQWLAQ